LEERRKTKNDGAEVLLGGGGRFKKKKGGVKPLKESQKEGIGGKSGKFAKGRRRGILSKH